MIAWNWRDKNNGEPMARVTVRHYLTREEMVELLCAHVSAGRHQGRAGQRSPA
jgi:hypothetical protein